MSRGAYRAIHTVLLDGPDFQTFSPEARHLFYALKLNLGATGIDVLYTATLEPQTGYAPDVVERALRELEAAGWLRRERNVCWLVEGLRNEPSRSLENPNHRKEIAAHADGLPRLAIVDAFRAHYAFPTKGMPAPSATRPHGMGDGMGDGIPNHGEREEGKKGEREEGKEPRAVEPPTAPAPSATATAIAPTTEPTGKPLKRSARPDRADRQEPAWFAPMWADYPKRSGSNSREDALAQATARVAAGESPDVLHAGTRRYAAWAHATGKVRTELVMQAARFYGRGKHYLHDWEPPATDAAPELDLAASEHARMDATDLWLAERRARERGAVPAIAHLNGHLDHLNDLEGIS